MSEESEILEKQEAAEKEGKSLDELSLETIDEVLPIVVRPILDMKYQAQIIGAYKALIHNKIITSNTSYRERVLLILNSLGLGANLENPIFIYICHFVCNGDPSVSLNKNMNDF